MGRVKEAGEAGGETKEETVTQKQFSEASGNSNVVCALLHLHY